MVPESKRVQTATDGLARRTGPVHARHGTMVPASGPMAKRPCVEMALEGVSQCCSGARARRIGGATGAWASRHYREQAMPKLQPHHANTCPPSAFPRGCRATEKYYVV